MHCYLYNMHQEWNGTPVLFIYILITSCLFSFLLSSSSVMMCDTLQEGYFPDNKIYIFAISHLYRKTKNYFLVVAIIINFEGFPVFKWRKVLLKQIYLYTTTGKCLNWFPDSCVWFLASRHQHLWYKRKLLHFQLLDRNPELFEMLGNFLETDNVNWSMNFNGAIINFFKLKW